MRLIPLLMYAFAMCMIAMPAKAYLDPGTGSLFLQGVIAMFATVSVSISLCWQHIKKTVRSWLGKAPDPTAPSHPSDKDAK